MHEHAKYEGQGKPQGDPSERHPFSSLLGQDRPAVYAAQPYRSLRSGLGKGRPISLTPKVCFRQRGQRNWLIIAPATNQILVRSGSKGACYKLLHPDKQKGAIAIGRNSNCENRREDAWPSWPLAWPKPRPAIGSYNGFPAGPGRRGTCTDTLILCQRSVPANCIETPGTLTYRASSANFYKKFTPVSLCCGGKRIAVPFACLSVLLERLVS